MKAGAKWIWGSAALLLLCGSGLLRPVVRPLTVGFCLALFLDPLRAFLEQRLLRPLWRISFLERRRRFISILLTLLLLVGGLGLLLLLAGPRLLQSLQQAAELLPALSRSAEAGADALSRELSARTGARLQLELPQLSSELLSFLLSGLGSAAEQLVDWGTALLLGAVFAVWMLAKKEAAFRLLRRAAALFPEEEALLADGQLFCRCFSSFVRGQLTEALILGGGCFVGMLLFRKPFAGLVSLVIAVTALVPVAGALVGGAFGALLLLSSGLSNGIWFLIFIVLLQQLENNLIYPRVMGRTIGLPAALVLLAVLLGGTLLGIPGMLLFVPAASFLWQKLQQLLREEQPP